MFPRELLKVSDETKALIMSTQLSNLQHKNQGTVTTVNDDDDVQMIDHAQSNIHLFLSEDFFNNLLLFQTFQLLSHHLFIVKIMLFYMPVAYFSRTR